VGLANLGSESETCVGSRVRLAGVLISIEKNFYRLPFTPPLSGSPYRSFTELETAQRELEDVSKKAGIAELEWEDQRKQLLETIDGAALESNL
jgi:hypothetical protein